MGLIDVVNREVFDVNVGPELGSSFGEIVSGRTGGWIQQWTTLRNLALLLDALGDTETAFFLDAAAEQAPDAPPRADELDFDHLSVDEAVEIRAQAAGAGRVRVLEIAHEAIARHRAGPTAESGRRPSQLGRATVSDELRH